MSLSVERTFACDRRHPSRSAPTVVLLHGWTATGSLNWSVTIAALEVRYRVVALDHRGQGLRIHGDGTFSLKGCADDVAALLAVLGVRRAIFVGSSMGGPVAQLIWRRHRHLVDGLVFCATAADFTSPHVDEPLLRAVDEMWRAIGPIRRSTHISKQVISHLLEARIGNRLLEALTRHDDDAIHGAGLAIGRFRSSSSPRSAHPPGTAMAARRHRRERHVVALLGQRPRHTVDEVPVEVGEDEAVIRSRGGGQAPAPCRRRQ